MAAKFLTDSAWYFYIFWLPKYLGDVRGLNIKEIGYFAWIPFAFAGFGSLLGGWLSSHLIRRGTTLDLSRKIALGLSACLMPVSLLIAASPLSFAIVFFSTAMFGHQFWSANVQTLPADIFPARVVGSVEGLLGCAGSFGGMLFGELVGRLVGPYGYAPAFVMAGIFHPIGFILILTIVRRIQRVSL
jgi:ACS family hexuronate transporter-like MFS transporter